MARYHSQMSLSGLPYNLRMLHWPGLALEWTEHVHTHRCSAGLHILFLVSVHICSASQQSEGLQIFEQSNAKIWYELKISVKKTKVMCISKDRSENLYRWTNVGTSRTIQI